MTQHALERLGERFPGISPQAALNEIRTGIASGPLSTVNSVKAGTVLHEIMLSNGAFAFALLDSNTGDIITVLCEGMETTTTTGRVTLARSGLPWGVHQISDTAYHSDPCRHPSLSSTQARTLLYQSPLHAWVSNSRLNPDFVPTEKSTYDIGRAAHRRTLGAGADYVEIPADLLSSNGAVGTKAAKEFVAEARDKGLTPLKGDEVAMIEAMKVKLDVKLAEYGIDLDPACSEMTVLAEIDGVACRAMIDNAPLDPRQPLRDFKTTTDASPQACAKAVMNYGYDVQARHYTECWKEATSENRRFQFIFQEKTDPFEVCVVELGFEALEMAAKKTARAREIWGNCTASGFWPGYRSEVVQIELPAYFHERWLEQESMAADHKRATGADILDYARRWQAPQAIAGE